MYGLAVDIATNRWGMRVDIVSDATLADYYDVEGVVARYATVGVTIPPQNFACKLSSFAPNVLGEKFEDETLLYPMLGLLYGFPIFKTMQLL